MQVCADNCVDGEKVKLKKGLWMKCSEGEWEKIERKSRIGPQGPPCEDDAALAANGSCSADRGHCSQYTTKGQEMDRDCPGTCGKFFTKHN